MMRPAPGRLALVLLPLLLFLLPACDTGSSGSSGGGTIGLPGGGGGGGGTVPDTDPPLDVTGFDAQATGVSGQVALTWTPSASTDAASYRITWVPATGGPAQPVTLSPASVASTTINGLADGTSYTITIQVVDTSGNVSTGVSDTVVPGSSSVYVEAAPHGGIYPAAVQVVFNYTGSGTVHYTTDGSDPTTTSVPTWTSGSAPIAISANTRLKYLLQLAAGSASATRSDIYEFPGGAGARFNKFSGMRISRIGHTATRLATAAAGQQDDVIVIGGIDLNQGSLAGESERFDRDFEHFDVGPTLGTPRWNHAAVLLPGGLVLVSGGQTGSPTNGLAFNPFPPGSGSLTAGTTVYDAAAGTFGAAGAMTLSRFYHTATRLYDNRVLLAGGLNGTVLGAGVVQNETESSTSVEIPGGTLFPGQILKGDFLEVLTGALGAAGQVGIVVSVTLADLAADPTDTDKITVAGLVGKVIFGDTVRILSGRPARAAQFCTSAGVPAGAAGSTVMPRYGHTATLLDDGTVLLAGGANDEDTKTIGDLLPELYDPAASSFGFAGVGDAAILSSNRFFHTATKLKDGKVLIAGGIDQGNTVFRSDGLTGSILNTADLYDPVTQTVSAVGTMTSPRFLHSATLLADGRVLVTGGIIAIVEGGPVIGETADLYDPVARSFTAVMTNDFRGENRSVTLSDGPWSWAAGASPPPSPATWRRSSSPRPTVSRPPPTASRASGPTAPPPP